MSLVGYTIFGRPVQHDYVSNGLFSELGLNNESYLSDHINLKKGQSLAILKRYKDQNGVEVTIVFLNTYAESYNERPGGFVGAGIAFIGKPSTKLIYHRLKNLHQQSLKLVDSKNFKFQVSKFDPDQTKLPDLSEDGLFISRTPKKYTAKDSTIAVSFSGSFYENLMSAIQGFCLNESYFSVKTAFVTNSENLLKSIVSDKSIYQIHNLLDYNYVFKKYSKLLADRKKKVEEDIKSTKLKYNQQKAKDERLLNERDKELINKEQSLNKREKTIKDREDYKKNLENKILSKSNDIGNLKDNIKKLEIKEKNLKAQNTKIQNSINYSKKNTFHESLNNPNFRDERKAFEENIKRGYKEELEGNRKTDWLKVLFALMSLGFLILSIILSYLWYKNNIDLKKINYKLSQKTNIINRLESEKKLNKLPIELSANDFFNLDNQLKADNKLSLKESIDFITNQNNDKNARESITNELLKRKWNFREILYDNVPDSIMGGLKVLDKLKNKSNARDNDLLDSPLFLIKQLRNTELKEEKIELKEDMIDADFLNEYLKRKDNIYDKLGIKYNKPEEGQTFQDSDPVLLMHFRWMIYNYKDKKKDIKEYKKGDDIKVPILK